jgi:hypothetical protein
MRRLAAALALLLGYASYAPAQELRATGPDAARIERAAPGRSLTPSSNRGAADVVRAYLEPRHGAQVVQSLVVTREEATPRGIVHVGLAQEVAGLPVYGAYVKAAVSRDGALLSIVDHLAPVPALVPARVGEADALRAVLGRRYPGVAVPGIVRTEGLTTVFAATPLFPDSPRVSRVAVPMENGALHGGFLVSTWDRENVLRYTLVGGGGRVLAEELRTNTDSYNVFAVHPGVTAQAVVSGPGTGNAESPAGWLTEVVPGQRTTIGNNVDAYLDRDNNNAADANGRPIVDQSGSFPFTADLASAPTTTANQQVAVTNLFYLNNVVHDRLYRHGFTEAAGNFQADNFGNGGAGGDPVNAEAQDGGGTNNANFATPSDGTRPRMQMYLWTSASPNRDGDLDSDIVYHEYGHGLTWRMIGNMQGALAGAIGEGMSDTLALYINSGDDRVAEYSYNNPLGIRRYPYTNYPLTYGDVTGSSVHNDGEIYAGSMWKLRSLWLGSGRAHDDLFDYVVDGMNHTPSRPAYEDMRDGILASIASDGTVSSAERQERQCVVWEAFAAFGIGEGADGREVCRGVMCRLSGITESFTVPSACGTEPPPPASIDLTATGQKAKGQKIVNLSWTGASGAVSVKRRFGGGSYETIAASVSGTSYQDAIAQKGGGTWTYQVCEVAFPATCSDEASVTF